MSESPDLDVLVERLKDHAHYHASMASDYSCDAGDDRLPEVEREAARGLMEDEDTNANLLRQAATEIIRLREERDEARAVIEDIAFSEVEARKPRALSAEATVSRLSEALRPFAEACACIETSRPNTRIIGRVLVEHFRKARAAIVTLDQGNQWVISSQSQPSAGPQGPSVDGKAS